MSIPLKISSKLIGSAAWRYTLDPKKVFMEFIDNSLDSAEDFFDESRNTYIKPIKIEILIDYVKNYATICDNCTWIPDITEIPQKIWDSNKAWINKKNWQFWFGMCSFVVIAKKLQIASKTVGNSAKQITIPASLFLEAVENPEIDDPIDVPFKYESWTEVTIVDIDKKTLKKDSKNYRISIDDLLLEIQRHFEGLLWRRNLEITVSDWVITKQCTPFDYSKYVWNLYEKTIDHSDLYLKWYTGNFDVKIFLKITEDKKVNRPPFFILKWRRIYDIKDCKEFLKKSAYARAIWDHPCIIGYIDLWDTVEPVLERDSFNMMWKKWDICRLIFKKIVEKEWEIKELLDWINRSNEDKATKNFENLLTSILSDFAREDRMNNRDELSKNWNSSSQWLMWNVEWIDGDMWNWQQDFSNWNVNNSDEDRNFWWWDWEWFWANWQEWNQFHWEKEDTESEFKGLSEFGDEFTNTHIKKKSWYSIKFDDSEKLIIDDETGKPVRAILAGSEIRIFRNHPDYLERKEYKNWVQILTERLVTYIAWQITIIYKDEYYEKNKIQTLRNKQMFEEVVDLIYRYESRLKDFIWKDLANLK